MKRDLVLSAAIVCVLSACKVSGDFGNTRFRCDEGNICPSGYSCVAGFCESEPSAQEVDAAPGTDARPLSDAAVPQSLCGTLGMLSEDFSDDLLDEDNWGIWTSGAVSIGHNQGQLILGYPADTSDIGGGYYSVDYRHLIEGSRTLVEVVEVDPNADVELHLEVKDVDDDMVRIRHYRGTLAFIYKIGDSELTVSSVPYDPVMHRFWQIREQGGQIYWETSPDGETFTTHDMRPSEPLLDYGEMQMWYWVNGPVAGGGRMVVDNFNGGMPSDEPWCSASSVTEDFAASEPSSSWGGWDKDACTRVFADGVFTFDTNSITGDERDCGIATRTFFDASASAISVEVPQVADGVETFLSLWLRNGDEAEMYYSGGRLHFEKRVGGMETGLGSLPYNATEHRWWRIRGDGGSVHWETSVDGSTWSAPHTSHTNPPLSLGEVEVGLWFYIPDTSTQSRASSFDNFNLSPQ